MNIIFDFDGTICDSIDVTIDILKKYSKKKQKYKDVKISKELIRNTGAKEAIKILKIRPTEIISFTRFYRKEASKMIPKLKAYKGIPGTIKQLNKLNRLGILSSNSIANIENFLVNNHLDKYFSFIHSENSIFRKNKALKRIIKKYSLDPKDTIYFGDETRDIDAAKKAGIMVVAVSWGFESTKLLKSANPNLLIDKPGELLKLVSFFARL